MPPSGVGIKRTSSTVPFGRVRSNCAHACVEPVAHEHVAHARFEMVVVELAALPQIGKHLLQGVMAGQPVLGQIQQFDRARRLMT